MNIELGKSYIVTPKHKKCFVETNYYKTPNGGFFTYQTVWRTGTVKLTLSEDWEVENLIADIDGGDCCPTGYEDYEMLDCWDSCSEDGWFDDEESSFSDLYEEWEEWDEEEEFGGSFQSWLEDVKEFEAFDYEIEIVDGIEVEEE